MRREIKAIISVIKGTGQILYLAEMSKEVEANVGWEGRHDYLLNKSLLWLIHFGH